MIGVDKNTVGKYIDLLDQAFVIFRVGSFNRNLRNEIKHNQKIYFYDNGIRNACIQNFNQLEFRNDIGSLWENFLISERVKRIHYNREYHSFYFWRTKQGKEIDWVEEKNEEIKAFEFKWNPNSKYKVPKKFEEAYQVKVEIISSKNFRDFVL